MTDLELRQSVIDELEYEPSLDAADIGVAVENGTVTLTGHVHSYSEKRAAETTVRRVKGVRAIAQEIEVRPSGANMNADDEIAKRAANFIDWNSSVPDGAVQVKVEKGWLTLTGKVQWHYQKSAAENAVHGLSGMRGISNLIEIVPTVTAKDVRQRIEDALKRDAELEALRISVAVSDRKVTLSGKVHSWSERNAAERAAWSAPGVTSVEDRIAIGA